LRRMIPLVLKHHPDRSSADFRCKSLPGVLCHGSIFSRIGAFGKSGAVQTVANRLLGIARVMLTNQTTFNPEKLPADRPQSA
jgi:hypothetical protein